MRGILAHFKKLDWVLIITALLLVGFGLLSIYSSSIGKGDFLNFEKQIVFFGVGIFLMFLFSFFDWRILRTNPCPILILYFLCLLMLLGLFFFAPETRGVKSWYRFGLVSFDPIEFTKLVLLLLLAKYFSIRHIEMYRIRHIFLSGLYILLPGILIFSQPNLGSVLVLLIMWLGILIVSGIKVRHFFLLLLISCLVAVSGWSFLLKDYQQERIMGFIHQTMGQQIDVLGSGWSQVQSEITIGSGGIFGKGIAKGPQTQYGFLPEPQTDFIFAALAEETGLLGVIILFSLLVLLIWRIFKISLSLENNFFRLFAMGFAILLSSQIFINIGMNLGFLPVIGISLPLVSYGGSNLIITFIGLGILESLPTGRQA